MPREPLSRITLLLPAPLTLPEFLLLNDIIDHTVRYAKGATVSSLYPPVFDGSWLEGGVVVQDRNVMIIIDTEVPAESPALAEYLDNLKLRCQQDFNQQIVWLTIHPIQRITTKDRAFM